MKKRTETRLDPYEDLLAGKAGRTSLNIRLLITFFGLLLLGSNRASHAQLTDAELPIYYTVDHGVTMYSPSDSTRPYLHLRFHEPVQMVENGGRWSRIRTMDGANGQVPNSVLSNVWLRISKRKQTLYVYRGSALITQYATDLGYNFFSDKERRGTTAEPDHWRTPEGEFYIVSKNPSSEFYRALVLNYPNGEDAERGKKNGLITDADYESIIQAHQEFRIPPMDTNLGGWIEIHGDGTGRRSNWTRGCIAVRNDQIDRLWDLVEIGTPVLIDP